MWRFRRRVVTMAQGAHVATFLRHVDWNLLGESSEALRLLSELPPRLDVVRSLELLGPDLAVPSVRAVALKGLMAAPLHEVLDYLPQLVQALRFEPNAAGEAHEAALAALLVDRAGEAVAFSTALYWYLSAEAEDPVMGNAFLRLRARLVKGLGPRARADLRRQVRADPEVEEGDGDGGIVVLFAWSSSFLTSRERERRLEVVFVPPAELIRTDLTPTTLIPL